MPAISVIMSVYNGEKYLKEAVDSILNQTFSDFEFIIVDDGSIDSSVEIINSYTDSRIQLIRNEKNIGLSGCRNIGIKLSKWKYIAMMDADDISLPERFAKQYEFMEMNPTIDVCGTQRKSFGAITDKYLVFTKHDEIVTNFLFNCKIVHPSVMLRKETILNLNQFYNSNFKVAQDYEYWIRLFLNGARFANLNEILLMYRWHSTNATLISEINQQQHAQNARKLIFHSLGIKDIDKKENLHELLRSGKSVDKSEIDEISIWIEELIAINSNNKLFPIDLLNKHLAFHWFRMHYASSHKGFWVWRSFKAPPVHSFTNISKQKKFQLFIKCLKSIQN